MGNYQLHFVTVGLRQCPSGQAARRVQKKVHRRRQEREEKIRQTDGEILSVSREILEHDNEKNEFPARGKSSHAIAQSYLILMTQNRGPQHVFLFCFTQF